MCGRGGWCGLCRTCIHSWAVAALYTLLLATIFIYIDCFVYISFHLFSIIYMYSKRVTYIESMKAIKNIGNAGREKCFTYKHSWKKNEEHNGLLWVICGAKFCASLQSSHTQRVISTNATHKLYPPAAGAAHVYKVEYNKAIRWEDSYTVEHVRDSARARAQIVQWRKLNNGNIWPSCT